MSHRCYKCGKEYAHAFSRCSRCYSWSGEDVGVEDSQGPKPLAKIKTHKVQRVTSGLASIDRAFDGGLVPGGIYLLEGDPGAGKSTLLLQLARAFDSTLYVTGEESEQHIKARANRLGLRGGVTVWETRALDPVLEYEFQTDFGLYIFDSVQALVMSDVNGLPGSVGQIVACGSSIADHMRSLSREGAPAVCVLVSQLNKQGDAAGPKALEHLVDTSCHLSLSREFTVIKNRHGRAPLRAQLRMGPEGLEEVGG